MILLTYTKLTSREIEPFLLLLIPEDSETDKHSPLTTERVRLNESTFHSMKIRKMEETNKKYTNYVWTDIGQFM